MARRILISVICLAQIPVYAASDTVLTVCDLVRSGRMSWFDAVKTETQSGKKYLDLGECGLTSLDGLAELPHIAEVQRLDLRSNKLSSLTKADLQCMPHLECLHASNNRFTELAEDTFEGTPRLTALGLSNNRLCSAIAVLKIFGQLRYIDVAYNSLSFFKPNVANSQLQSCNVSHNPSPYACPDVGGLMLLCPQLIQLHDGVFCTPEHYHKTRYA